MTGYFALYAADYDRFQPVNIEMYRFYHRLALDVVPFEQDEGFKVADIGCGTGTFLAMLSERFPNSEGVAVDLSQEMLDLAREKVPGDRFEFVQHDLNMPLPSSLSEIDMTVAFSSLHHLPDQRKRSIYEEIYSALKPGGYLLLIDAMYVPYTDRLWAQGRRREDAERAKRMSEAGIDLADHRRREHTKSSLEADSPERDRISSLDSQLASLQDAGFGTVDRIWHFWMEHLIVARR